MADTQEAWQRVHDAFSQRGFKRDWSVRSKTYAGLLDPTDLKVKAFVEVPDLDFVRPPTIRLADRPDVKRTIPHLLNSGMSLCYLEQGAILLDRYDPGGTVLQCLEKADKVLRDGVRGRLDDDFADEFLAYWGSSPVLVDLADDFAGNATVNARDSDSRGEAHLVLTSGASWLTRRQIVRRRSGPPPGQPCRIVRTPRRLSIDPNGHWPPDTLVEFNAWLSWAEPSLVGSIEETFQASGSTAQWLAIAAANGLFLARISLPLEFRKPEFTDNRRRRLSKVWGHISGKMTVDRFTGYRADTRYVFGRNMSGIKSLVGKHILLVGCGTIGGFLAHQLAQAGAGAEGGKLTLVDKDVMGTGNLGRHLLGAPYLGRNKAEGCAAFLIDQLPMLKVVPQARDILNRGPTLDRFDLVIDATGEETLSIALNARIVGLRPCAPAAVFVWLIGNGAAAQCLLVVGNEAACFKCLKPVLAGEPRFQTLKKDVQTEVERNLACGDARYVPFPVSRSVAAASLACEVALDWVNDVREPAFRSLTLDRRKAYQVKDANPAKAKACPACGERS